MPDPPHRYGHVAWCYDALASAYSLGAIDRVKAYHHRLINPGDRVLYAGTGCGREVVQTCARGAQVTGIEPCPAMAARLRQRLSAHNVQATIDPRPIEQFNDEARFDCVVAHFFLNVFGPTTMPTILDRLCDCVKPGGRIVIADFKPTPGRAGVTDRLLRRLYYRPVNLAGRLLGICDLHPIYDYDPLLIERGFAIESRNSVRGLPWPDRFYEVIAARRTQ